MFVGEKIDFFNSDDSKISPRTKGFIIGGISLVILGIAAGILANYVPHSTWQNIEHSILQHAQNLEHTLQEHVWEPLKSGMHDPQVLKWVAVGSGTAIGALGLGIAVMHIRNSIFGYSNEIGKDLEGTDLLGQSPRE